MALRGVMVGMVAAVAVLFHGMWVSSGFNFYGLSGYGGEQNDSIDCTSGSVAPDCPFGSGSEIVFGPLVFSPPEFDSSRLGDGLYDFYPDTNGTDPAHEEIRKRWYSIVSADPEIGRPVPWPALKDVVSAGTYSPQNANQRWVRYCFVDETASNALYRITLMAIARWAIVMKETSMSIMPDFSCYDCSTNKASYNCLCSAKTSVDALRISSDWDPNSDRRPSGATSLGYLKVNPNQPRTPPNTMKMRFPDQSQRAAAIANEPDLVNMGISAMAHEFGHAFGLEHEFQRPDAEPMNYVKIDLSGTRTWQTLLADSATMAQIRQATGIRNDDNLALTRVSSNPTWAARWLPLALQFMPAPEINSQPAGWWAYNTEYDYNSIMNYDSEYVGNAVVKKNADGTTSPLVMGGTTDWGRKGPSRWDLTRMMQLYPKSGGSGRKARDDLTAREEVEFVGNYSGLIVYIGNFTTTMLPPPGW